MYSNFVNKYKTKYSDYSLQNNYCQANSNFHTFQVQPNMMDQIEDNHFWNRAYNYTNIITEGGKTIGLKGVCNPLLINNCEKPENNSEGICDTNNYINTKLYHISYKKNKQ